MVVAIRKAAAGAAMVGLVATLASLVFSVPAYSKKITHPEDLSSLKPGSFEAFMQQFSHHTSALPSKILTEGRKVGMKLVRCTRVDLNGEWPMGRMAKVTGSGWSNSQASLRIGIWPEEPPSLFDLETEEGMKRKSVEKKKAEARLAAVQVAVTKKVDTGDDKPPTPSDDNKPKPPEVDTGDEKPPTPPEVDTGDDKPPTPPEVDTGDDKPPTPPEVDTGDEKPPTPPDDNKPKPPEVDTGDEHEIPDDEIDTGDIKEQKVLVLADHAKDDDEKLKDHVDEPSYKMVREDWEPAETGHGELMPAFVTTKSTSRFIFDHVSSSLKDSARKNEGEGSLTPLSTPDEEKDNGGGGSVTPLPTPDDGGANVTPLPTPDDGGANVTPLPTPDDGGANVTPLPAPDDGGANVTPLPAPDEEKKKDESDINVTPLPHRNLTLEILRRMRRQARAVMTVTPKLTNRQLATFLEFLDGKAAKVDKLKSLISENFTMVALPSDEQLIAAVHLLNKKDAYKDAKTVAAARKVMVVVLPVLNQRKSGVTGGSAQFAAQLADPGIRFWKKRQHKIDELEDWKPIFGFEIQRFQFSDAEVEKKVDDKIAKLLPIDDKEPSVLPIDGKEPSVLPIDGKEPSVLPIDGKEPSVLPVEETEAAKKIAAVAQTVKREQREEIRITGPVTCTTFVVKADGTHKAASQTETPMITPERGFMAVITRTLDGFEFDLYGWTTEGSMSSWKSVHVDNVPVERITTPRIIMAEKDAAVKSLRYYVSKDIEVNEARCEKVVDHADCTLSEWTNWTPCTTTCGLGEMHRARKILTDVIGNGKCDQALSDVKLCNADKPCSSSFQDCEMSEWGPFSTCSVTCGNGTMSRSRRILKQPVGDGLACGALTNTVPCHNKPCPGA